MHFNKNAIILCLHLDSDAMGKPQSGFELGNLAWFGSYSECKNITGAHYCLASIKVDIPLPKPEKVSIVQSV